MTTKHVKANPKTRYKLRIEYQKHRQRQKKRKLLIVTTIYLLVCGVILKGTVAEDYEDIKGNIETISTVSSNDDPTTNEAASTVSETTIDEDSSFVNSTTDDSIQNKNYARIAEDINKLPFRLDRRGHGTEHEQVGVAHFKPVLLTPFTPTVNYSNVLPKYRYGMDHVFKFSNSLIDAMVPDDTFPEGYVEIREDKHFYMGRRVENNDWMPLLSRYKVVLFVVIFFLLLIIIMPCIAVCYYCFSCYKRCGRHCPPCDEKRDKCRRCCYGIILFILIIGLTFGVFTAFAANRLMENGFIESTKNIARSSEDTCRFLTNTNNHLKHLYINNYQEMVTQLTKEMRGNYGSEHIGVDLSEVSMANRLQNLVRIFENMKEALKNFKELEGLEKQARFYAAQLRDSLRGSKRDLQYFRSRYCFNKLCLDLYKDFKVHRMDLGCLHYDNVPDTTIYIEALGNIIKQDLVKIPLEALVKLRTIDDTISKLHSLIFPSIISILEGGIGTMTSEAQTISSIVNKVISDIHLKTIRTTHSFDDIYSKLGGYRNLINVALCSILLVILICLIVALCYGCFARRRRAYHYDCCNKGSGAKCLLFAIFLIFLTFSITALIGIFYFVFGLVAYHGACAPLRDTTRNAVFNSLDSYIDFQKLSPPSKTGDPSDDSTENPLPPIRLSYALNACRLNESIMDVLDLNKYFIIQNLKLLNIVKRVSHDAINAPKLKNVLHDFRMVSARDMLKLENVRRSKMSSYHSKLYKNEMCTPNFPLGAFLAKVDTMLRILPREYPEWVPYHNTRVQVRKFETKIHRKLTLILARINILLNKIDKGILYKNLNFEESFESILYDVRRAQVFIDDRGDAFVNEVTVNLTNHIVYQVGVYRNFVINETKWNVGRCKPLAYIYENGIDIVCDQMVDPMNGFWMGVLLCCLLFLPILFVAQKLQCLYKKVGPYVPPAVTDGCPECTGAPGPIKPATVMVCRDGPGTKKCPCPSLKHNVQKSDDCSCSNEAIKAPRSPRGQRPKSKGNDVTLNEWGDFFDVEAQQKIDFHGSSNAFPKRKID